MAGQGKDSVKAIFYAMLDWGIRAAIAPSFGDIHYANEIQNGMLPAIEAYEKQRFAKMPWLA